MKQSAWPGFGLVFAVSLLSCTVEGQDEPVVDSTVTDPPRIIGPVADGTPPTPAPPREMPDFQVMNTTVRQEGGRTITIHRVEDPQLPEPAKPPPAPAIDPNDPEVRAWLAEMREQAKSMHLALVSATVYDHEKTLVRWWIPGRPERSFTAWSNIDFNHLCGFGTFEVGDAQYGLLMGIGDVDTVVWKELLEKHGRTYEPPASPELAADRPAFVLTEGDAGDREGMAMIEGLHALYATERERLVAAYEGRVQARKEREAYLKAHPPKPEDVVIHFWKNK